MPVDAVIFDMDGVIVDSEALWDRARHELVIAHGGRWPPEAQRTMMGMSSPEWSAYLHDLGVGLAPEEISRRVVGRMLRLYELDLPLLPGATAAVHRLGARWPLGLASSANREIIDAVLARAGLVDAFAATVSSEEVERGKPAPDVYLSAARGVGVAPERCAAVEDSSNGLRAAAAAGMAVVALPNPTYPPAADALALAHTVVERLDDLTVEAVQAADQARGR